MATSQIGAVTPKAIERPRRLVPLTSRTTGRAITSRRARRPIAPITARKTTHRAISSRGVAADSDVDGIGNWGAGPAFGPTANVNAPRTGCPSTETARQKTRYQPSWVRLSGTSRVSGFAGDRRGGPAASCRPPASVTDTIAKRGSTASLYVNATCFGGVLSVTLASGTVLISAACAAAAAGRARAANAAAVRT